MVAISTSYESADFDTTIRAMHAMPAFIKREVAKEGRGLAEPLARAIAAAGARGARQSPLVAATSKAGFSRGVATVKAGQSGLAAALAKGAEFGGGDRRTTYWTRSRAGNPYVVTRATTRQFGLPHTGTKGRWFYPTVRARGDLVLKPWSELVDRVIAGFHNGG